MFSIFGFHSWFPFMVLFILALSAFDSHSWFFLLMFLLLVLLTFAFGVLGCGSLFFVRGSCSWFS
jgi:hypothetical protein